MIQNLSQLKKIMKPRVQFRITAHCRPECVGQLRQVTIANTQGFYSIRPDKQDSKCSTANGGRGSVLWWSKAPCWEFKEGICSIYSSDTEHMENNLIMSFYVLEEEET